MTAQDVALSLVFDLEQDDTPELTVEPKKLALSIKEFIEDFRTKIPANVAGIDMFVYVDKTGIKKAETYTRFTFVPARINLLDKQRKSLGFISVTKLLAIYGTTFRLSAYESNWSKLVQTVKINVIHVNLTPKISKNGKEYYNTDILPIPASNTKAIETLEQYYEQVPTCRWQRPTEYTNDLQDDEIELDCGV